MCSKRPFGSRSCTLVPYAFPRKKKRCTSSIAKGTPKVGGAGFEGYVRTACLPSPLVYPRGAGGRVLERDHVAHVERHHVVELDALVRGGGAQPLPVLRHLWGSKRMSEEGSRAVGIRVVSRLREKKIPWGGHGLKLRGCYQGIIIPF